MKVIKLGGSLLDDAVRRADVLREIAAQWNAGDDLVLVHGGGKHVDAQLAKLGIAKRTHAGLRVTDDATLDVVADSAASAIAIALGAESLIFITDVEGLLDARGEVVRELRPHEADALLDSEVVSGGMRPKLQAALQALGSGVGRITIGLTE